jgi:nucleoside-diphosphate kinase
VEKNALLKAHYAGHEGKSFYEGLVRYMTQGPVIAPAPEGEDAAALVRRLTGSTNTNESRPGLIRGDYATSGRLPIIHVSGADPEEAEKEISRFVQPDEFCEWQDPKDAWFYDRYDWA